MGLLGLTKDTLGEVAAPGEGTEDLTVTLRPAAGGAEVPIAPRRGIHEGAVWRSIYRDLGSAEIPAAGDYVISSSMTVVEGDHHSPRISARA